MKFIWDVGGRLREFSRRDAGGHNVMITRRRDVGKTRCGMWDVKEKLSGMWEFPSQKQWEAPSDVIYSWFLISENKLV